MIELNKKSPSRGYRRINEAILRKTGWILSDWIVHKVCKSLNIKSKAGKYLNKKVEGNQHLKFPRLVKNWNTTRPFEKVSSDTTLIRYNGKRYDFTFYLDAYNNEIISYDICDYKYGQDVKHHINALQKFCKEKIKRGYKDQVTFLHTDQGSIYASRAFEEAHKDYNIKRSMSRAGTPKDNGIIESTNRWIKAELKYDFKFLDCEDVNQVMSKYIYYYNNERGIHKLKKKSPVEYLIQQNF